VRAAVEQDLPAEQVLFSYLHLTHPLVAPLARPILAIFWESITYYLYDARKLYSILTANSDVAVILNTEKGHKWLDRCCVNGIVWLYNYIWPPAPPQEIEFI
jgi:alanine dehydrogenase